MLDKKREQKKVKSGKTSPFLGFTKKSSMLPRLVWAEGSKNGLGFEIGPSYDDAPRRSQLVTDRQSSCKKMYSEPGGYACRDMQCIERALPVFFIKKGISVPFHHTNPILYYNVNSTLNWARNKSSISLTGVN